MVEVGLGAEIFSRLHAVFGTRDKLELRRAADQAHLKATGQRLAFHEALDEIPNRPRKSPRPPPPPDLEGRLEVEDEMMKDALGGR